MKNWYLLVRFDGSYVTGFLVFNQPDEESARKALLFDLICRKKSLIAKYKGADPYLDLKRIRSFIKSISHPWRHTKEKFAHPEAPVIRYIELKNEIINTNYWLEECKSGEYYCNIGSCTARVPAVLQQGG